jgi:GAF domain-containing protein
MSYPVDRPQLQRLADIAGSLVAEFAPQVVFDRILDTASEMTGARYSALAVVNEERDGLEHFHTAGVGDLMPAASGDPSRAPSVPGDLILGGRLRHKNDVPEPPRRHRFPDADPVAHDFLGVPIAIDGVVWGNLYLAEKAGGPFTEADEEIALVLASLAARAIETARPQRSGVQRERGW